LKDTFRERWPEITLRFFDWLLSLVVFAAIADKGQKDGCWFGYKLNMTTLTATTNTGACSFAIFMGVLTWGFDFILILLIFLKDLSPGLAARAPKAAPLIMFIIKALWTFFLVCNCHELGCSIHSHLYNYGKSWKNMFGS